MVQVAAPSTVELGTALAESPFSSGRLVGHQRESVLAARERRIGLVRCGVKAGKATERDFETGKLRVVCPGYVRSTRTIWRRWKQCKNRKQCSVLSDCVQRGVKKLPLEEEAMTVGKVENGVILVQESTERGLRKAPADASTGKLDRKTVNATRAKPPT